jgi:site-specific DNA recombinase
MREGVDRPVGDEARWTAPAGPDDPKRPDTTSGHLGSGRYLCGLCDRPVETQPARYSCAGHIMRSREHVDQFVLDVVRTRLGMADAHDLLPSQDEPRLRPIKNEVGQHRAEIIRSRRDYNNEIRDGRELKRIREHEEAAITVLEAKSMRQTAGSNASPVHGAENLVNAFDNLDLGAQRAVIEVLCDVRLYPHPQGVKRFDPKTVQISWR